MGLARQVEICFCEGRLKSTGWVCTSNKVSLVEQEGKIVFFGEIVKTSWGICIQCKAFLLLIGKDSAFG